MAFRIVADSQNDLPEGLRAAAKSDGGKFIVESLPDGWGLEDVTGMKATLSVERTQRKAAEKSLAAFEGIDDAAGAREAYLQMRAGKLKTSKEFEDFRTQYESKSTSEHAKKDQKYAVAMEQLRKVMVEGAALQAIAEAGGNPRLLMPILRSAIKAEPDEDGKFSVTITDEQGKELISSAEGSTRPMTIPELVQQLRTQPDMKAAFAGSGTGGSGSSHAAGGSGLGGQQKTNLSSMDLLQRANSRQ